MSNEQVRLELFPRHIFSKNWRRTVVYCNKIFRCLERSSKRLLWIFSQHFTWWKLKLFTYVIIKFHTFCFIYIHQKHWFSVRGACEGVEQECSEVRVTWQAMVLITQVLLWRYIQIPTSIWQCIVIWQCTLGKKKNGDKVLLFFPL